jgi:hypothetical protein
MRNRTRLLIPWGLLGSVSLTWVACGGKEGVDFPEYDAGSVEGGRGGIGGRGGSATGGVGGTAGSDATGGGGGSVAGSGGASGAGGASGSGGAGGAGAAAGNGGVGGSAGTAGKAGAGGKAGTAGSAGTAGKAGAAGSGGASGGGGSAGSGAAGSAGSGGASGSGNDAGDASRDGAVDGSIDARAEASTVEAGRDAALDGTDAGCPNVLGSYQFNNADGACSDLFEDAPQEIRSAGPACVLNFISANDAGSGLAINGTAPLGSDGTFSGATLTLGTTSRSPCSASWSEVDQEITVTCGNVGDECLMELRRIGP